MDAHSLLSLPLCIFGEVLSDWISGADLIRLDSALCSTVVRPTLLELLSAPQFVVKWNNNDNPQTTDQLVKWANKRQTGLRTICVGDESNLDLYEQYLSVKGRGILSFRIDDVERDTDRLFGIISTYCSKITKLECYLTDYGDSLRNVLSTCTSLRDLRCDATSTPLDLICTNLHTFVLNRNHNFDIQALLLKMVPNVKFLQLKRCVDKRALQHDINPGVVRLGITETTLNDSTMINILQRCPHITHLNLDSAIFESAGGLIYAAEHLTELTSVNVSYSNVTNTFIQALTYNRAHTLTELYMLQCYDVSVNMVNAVIHRCTHLTALGVHCRDGQYMVDIPQLSRITRLTLVYEGTRGAALIDLLATHCLSLQYFSLYSVHYISPSKLDALLHQCTHLTSLNLQIEGLERESYAPADAQRWRGIRAGLKVGEKPEVYDMFYDVS